MPQLRQLLLVAVPAILFSLLASGQLQQPAAPNGPRHYPIAVPRLPPEIVIPPGQYTTEFDNADMRAIRVIIPGKSVLPQFGSGRGLLISITDLQLRLARTNLSLRAGQTQWVTQTSASIENLSANPCEFLLIEPKR